jgi:DNA-binding MarR family transcriptional regulator
MNWLSEKGYLTKDGKAKKNDAITRDLAEEIDLHDTMLTSLVELLEQKGILTQEEWEKRIKKRVSIE